MLRQNGRSGYDFVKEGAAKPGFRARTSKAACCRSKRKRDIPLVWQAHSAGPTRLTPCTTKFFHAIARQVFFGKMSFADAEAVDDNWRRDQAGGLWLRIALPENAFEICANPARRCDTRPGLRSLDSLHVAARWNSRPIASAPSTKGRRSWRGRRG